MSTVIRNSAKGQSQGVRPVDPHGRWEWPDPIEIAPTTAPYVAPQTVPLAASWQCAPLPQSWPPLPKSEFVGQPKPQPQAAQVSYSPERRARPRVVPETEQWPGHSWENAPERRPEPRHVAPIPTPAKPAIAPAPQVAAPSVGGTMAQGFTAFGRSAAGSVSFSQDWAAIPAEPQRTSDPSPSRLTYRLNRLWLTPTVRHFVRVGLPILLVVALVGGWLSDEGRRAGLVNAMVSVRTAIENRPQFQVTGLVVTSRSPEVAQGVAQLLGIDFPISSFQLDLSALRDTVEALDAVKHASLQVRNGELEVVIEERTPAMIWRNGAGLDLIDGRGHRVARLASRAARPDLPLIAGAGAPDAIAEARQLWTAAAPLHSRIRGLVRVGERRWDVILDRDQRIMLPAEGALGALERVLALNAAQDVLARDVRVVDLRNPGRPTLRLSPESMTELTRIRRQSSGAMNR